jgi:catechol 2,3-dioxygenase-like lactoylglutathione lyase family enzyme
MSLVFPTPVPEVPVSDIATATEYYQHQLGFDLDWGGADGDLAGISRDNCRIFLAGPEFRKGHGGASLSVIWLNLGSRAEVDELHRSWTGTKAILQSAPEDKPWGLREFTAADPDGIVFRVFYDFATPAREQTARAAG